MNMNQQPSQDPLYAGPRQAGRPQPNARDPPMNDLSSFRPNGRPDDAQDTNQSRAARYEDEKRRIIESCFAKKEEDGIAAESYITHVRVVEDGAYPSSPPPPDSSTANKKSRIIIVAVRKSGRVRVHKARENPTGTFSIGKTWPLEELTAIQSYSNLVPRSNQEQIEKQWANGFGFIVTLGKPYYWQAPTSKEKDFFIGSLVKIYRKYTGGKSPELSGFATQELDLLTGTPISPNLQSQSQRPPISAQSVSQPAPLPIPASIERRTQSPQSFRSQGSDQTNRPWAQPRHDQPPPARDTQRPPPIEPLRSPMRGEHRDAQSQRSFDSGSKAESIEQLPPQGYLQPVISRSSPSPLSSQQSLPTDKANGTLLNGASVPRTLQPAFLEQQESSTSSLHSANSRPSTAVSDQKSFEARTEKPPIPVEPPQDRRKLFLAKSDVYLTPRPGAVSESNSQFATPAASPSEFPQDKPVETSSNRDHATNIPSSTQKDYFSQGQDVTTANPTEPVTTPKLLSAHAQATVADNESAPVKTESVPIPPRTEEDHRPGLGPMIKKKSAKDIAGQFRKAALAASAFQPRQGGAGARLKALQDKDKISDEPDGITGVVPAPLLRGMSSDTQKSSVSATPNSIATQEHESSSTVNEITSKTQIQRSVTEDSVTTPDIIAVEPAAPIEEAPRPLVRSPSPEKPRSRSPQRRKRQRQEAELGKYCSALGIDLRVLEGRGAEFNDLLTEFGWQGKLVEHRAVEEFEASIKREIGRAQATGWLGHVEQQESKVQDLAKAFDKAIEECDELDGLFTLYSHELDTLAADIDYIEAQSQGLQVQTANQKLLQNELNSLLRTLTIPSSDLRGLQAGSLDNDTGVETVERCLGLLYTALATIDPEIQQNKKRQAVSSNPDRGGIGVYADTEIGQMRAVREKKDQYRDVAISFVQRFNQHMNAMFEGTDEKSLQDEKQKLWRYNAMMLFVREVNQYEWRTLITSYGMSLKSAYQTQFRDYAMDQRRMLRRPAPEESEALFTTQEKDKSEETLASTAARKLTVKRGKTVKTGALRQHLGEKQDGKLDAYEVFETVVKQQSNNISEQQNFIVCLFHLNSQTSADFTEIVSSKSSNNRRLPNIQAKQPYDPDRNMAKIVQNATEDIYSFWLGDLQNLLDWVLSVDSLQGVGVLTALEQCLANYEETNQEFITRTMRTIHERLIGLFHKFVDEQIRAIEETKVKVKKRKGVISFMRTFPLFSSTVEQMIPADMSSHDVLEVRFILNDAYARILKAMWESLSFIAKDDPVTGGGTHSNAPTSGDPEDKEALNYHILLIENMNHYLEEVDTQKNVVLDDWADKARQDFSTHLAQYTESVIRRPLGKWLDFLESTEAMMKGSDTGAFSNKPSHSRSAAKKVLSSYDNKEIRKGIETLKKRIEKHFGDVDDPSSSSKALITRVFDECSTRYASSHDRMENVINKVYEGNLEIDWSKAEVTTLFKR